MFGALNKAAGRVRIAKHDPQQQGSEQGPEPSGLAHDLEHACAALGARALHGTTPVGHNVLFRIFHHPFCFALYAIAFYFSCHILWSFEVSYVMQGNWIAGLLSYWFSTRVSG